MHLILHGNITSVMACNYNVLIKSVYFTCFFKCPLPSATSDCLTSRGSLLLKECQKKDKSVPHVYK